MPGTKKRACGSSRAHAILRTVTSLQQAKIAIVADWLTTDGGAEKVVAAIHEIVPQAPIYTTLYDKERVPYFENATVHTSWLQKIPGARKHHQWFLPWMPTIFENMNLDEYDIVISSSHSCAKGIITKPTTMHLCYCHSPMRYAWDNAHEYIEEYSMNPLLKWLGRRIIHRIRIWDRMAAERVDTYCTNAHFVAQRIKKYYRKVADVIYPPVETKYFKPAQGEKTYYLAVGRLTPYKKFRLIVEAFNALNKPLIIVGTGVEERDLRARAHKNIHFLGHVDNDELAVLYAQARALIFPQTEDFGITPVEAMATGRPVIAYAAGGALETVIPGKTGILFKDQSAVGIINAVHEFERHATAHNTPFDPDAISKHAQRFSKERFQKDFRAYVEQAWAQFKQ